MFGSTNKRQRDEEVDAISPNSWRGRKKPRPLALKPTHSLHSKLQLQTQPDLSHPVPTLTPGHSSEDEDGAPPHDSLRTLRPDDNAPQFTQIQSCGDGESDLEMVDSTRSSNESLPLPSAGLSPMCCDRSTLSPIPSNVVDRSLNFSGGRTATPIYSHFMGNMPPKMTMDDGANSSVLLPSNKTPGSMQSSRNDLSRQRRLPSPISEDENINALSQEQFWRAVQNNNTQVYPSAIPYTGVNHDTAPKLPSIHMADAQTMHLANYGEESVHGTKQSLPENRAYPVPPAFSEPGNGLQNQYGNPTNADMLQRQKKASIAMGFRADCDKCQRRVPGHYSHIVYS